VGVGGGQGGGGGDSHERYARWATQILDESALQRASQLTVEFDPSYETVILHAITVLRGGERLNRLQPNTIKVVQREPNLEAQMYDGRRSLVMFLEDMRVGDVVDSEATVSGADEALAGHLRDTLVLGTTSAVERVHTRLILPPGHLVHMRPVGPDAASLDFVMTRSPYGDEYVWNRTRTPAYP